MSTKATAQQHPPFVCVVPAVLQLPRRAAIPSQPACFSLPTRPFSVTESTTATATAVHEHLQRPCSHKQGRRLRHPRRYLLFTRPMLYRRLKDSREVVEEYSEIKYEEVIIENGCMMNMANPTALMLSGVSILRHLNFHNKADQIQNAIFNTIVEEKYRTADLGGKAKTIEFTNIVI
ncbi:uncharacterized protein [Arachis hypogaea]|uniref:Isopropylmalate dehydrogenase-like domain-containing protein n=1 Tax=Arachis hypogaea TaxID=3818 RepID=A0A445BAN3_ARAHY|nr:uncharacterized protein LOC112714805 isoform X2 [Arachis hypogaea]QHO15100.1 Isocitrate dehydrogenase [NAD] catalytic subunit 5 [Arachis hypogaea]RYR35742.1 hypothetical protein Ahy_A10g050863 isoform B [Arachis hypogaea]